MGEDIIYFRIFTLEFKSLRLYFAGSAASEKSAILGPSFPHASSGNPGESGSGPPIKTFGGDEIGKVLR
jgi:hypothetical protein